MNTYPTEISSVTQLCLTLCDPMDCSTSIINSQSLLKLMSLSRWCHPTISSSVIPFSFGLQFFPASGSSNESVIRIRWPKYWSFSFSFSISPSNEYSGPISFRMDWLDLLAVQETFKSLFQHHGWNKFHEKILVLLLCVCSNLAVLFFFPFFKSGIFNLLNWFHHLLTGYHLQFVKALSQDSFCGKLQLVWVQQVWTMWKLVLQSRNPRDRTDFRAACHQSPGLICLCLWSDFYSAVFNLRLPSLLA